MLIYIGDVHNVQSISANSQAEAWKSHPGYGAGRGIHDWGCLNLGCTSKWALSKTRWFIVNSVVLLLTYWKMFKGVVTIHYLNMFFFKTKTRPSSQPDLWRWSHRVSRHAGRDLSPKKVEFDKGLGAWLPPGLLSFRLGAAVNDNGATFWHNPSSVPVFDCHRREHKYRPIYIYIHTACPGFLYIMSIWVRISITFIPSYGTKNHTPLTNPS